LGNSIKEDWLKLFDGEKKTEIRKSPETVQQRKLVIKEPFVTSQRFKSVSVYEIVL